MTKEKFELFKVLQQGDDIFPDPWSLERLRDVCQFEYGAGLTKEERDGGDYPVYGSAGVVGYHTEPYVDGTGIITARKGSIGEVSYSEDSFYPIDTTYYVSEDETEQHLRWLYYALDLLELDRVNASTAIPSLNRNDAGSLRVPVPPVGEQERIASVLYTVDKHVEALDQRHSSLQDLKHALMQDLLTGKRRFDGEEVNLSSDEFEGYKVDDEPPVVLANWSGMKLPEGWSRENIGDIIDVTTGDSFSSDRFEDEGDYILIKNKTVKEQEPEVYISGDIDEQYIIEEGDLLVTMDGEFTSREWKLGEAALNQRVCKVEPKNGLHKRFLRYALEYPLSHIQDYKAGTTVKHLSTKDFNDILLPVPPKVEQERIASVLYTVDEMIARTSELRDEYEQLKRGLMQDLLSGEVRTSAELDVMDEVTA